MICVSGIGVVSSIGMNVSENLESLLGYKTGIAPLTDIQSLRKPFLGGRVRKSNEELKLLLGIPSEKTVPRSALFSMLAAREALAKTDIHDGFKTGVICSTSVGGMDLSEQFYFDMKAKGDFSKIDHLSVHDNGAGTFILADYFGIKDNIFTISTACSSAANAILLGSRLINAGILDRVLVGGGDALTNFTLNGFDSLMIFDAEQCKPFDDKRKGLNLGEGAGFLLLESENLAKRNGKKPLGTVKGWANTNDSYHQTASSPDGKGATLAIQQALSMAQLSPSDIDYVNAHGTATPNNDLSESMAFKNVFGNNVPPFSSTKGFTGHTLAAAGGIEAVFAILAIQQQQAFANLNFETPMSDTDIRPLTETTALSIQNVVSNSFGFGGNCTSLVFSS